MTDQNKSKIHDEFEEGPRSETINPAGSDQFNISDHHLPPFSSGTNAHLIEIIPGFDEIKQSAERFEIKSGEDLIHLIASEANSGLVLSAESFLSKHWCRIWNYEDEPVVHILNALSVARTTINREMLYRLLLKILDARRNNLGAQSCAWLAMLSVEVSSDITAANQSEPLDGKNLPPMIKDMLPPASEFVVCSLALECLFLMNGEETASPWKMPKPPVLTQSALEEISRTLGKRYGGSSTPSTRDYCEQIIRKVVSWQG